ncbi:PorT family protein [Ginsengibacter hankyongi]|uniref:PorT family protein n=1 Tax=Ginsengibacter hankyongi TaxID=2607284 RepID=A0A5J5IHM8_9BACT|nr:outer membrane beta-barrel protein [Ginsengibacter hankyongi]KAA9039173.1 PorT family protein [Ginsengibacter hankyongi]
MEENKFEKQVQQKMDELKIQPSESVWKKIEVRIEKKKDRKWGLIILFLFTGLVLSGGYWLWNTMQQRLSGNHTSITSASLKNTTQASGKENEKAQPENNSVPGPVNQKENQTADLAGKNDNDKNNTHYYKVLKNSKANAKRNSKEKTAIAFFKQKKVATKIKEKIESGIISGQSSDVQVENKMKNEFKDSVHEKINGVTSSKPVAVNAATKDSDTLKNKKANTATVKQSKKNKWKFGILFSGGISGVGKDFLALNNPPVYSSPGSLNSGGSQSAFSSSITKSGFGFIAGVFAEKNISKKAKLVSGINFKSFNISNKLYDSSGRYSARLTTNKFIDHLSFVEVPFSIKIQIGKEKNIPLFLQGGLVLSELIYSNALQFSPTTGYYYKDNSLLNKTQVGLNTAILMSLYSRQKTSILIGPYFYYDASKIANEGLYNKKRFVFTGLHTEINFSK